MILLTWKVYLLEKCKKRSEEMINKKKRVCLETNDKEVALLCALPSFSLPEGVDEIVYFS
jgi:hypothetical protein